LKGPPRFPQYFTSAMLVPAMAVHERAKGPSGELSDAGAFELTTVPSL
jgi:hypothetical protein